MFNDELTVESELLYDFEDRDSTAAESCEEEISTPDFVLGSPFVPCDIYALFFKNIFRLKEKPIVSFRPLIGKFKIIPEDYDDVRRAQNNPVYSTRWINGLEIAEKTMNAANIEKINRSTGKLDVELTRESIDIQTKLINAFKMFVYSSHGMCKRISEEFKKGCGSLKNTKYSGNKLTLPDLNPDINIRPKQLRGIERLVFSDSNQLIAYKVGAGKRYIFIAAAHELYRRGKSRRIMIVVQKNILHEFAGDHKRLYPKDKIIVVDSKDFAPQKRAETVQMLKNSEYTAVYISYECFGKLPVSKRIKQRKMIEEINEVKEAAAKEKYFFERYPLIKQAEKLCTAYHKFSNTYMDPEWGCFDDLKIDTLFVDEAHNFKNIKINASNINITGLSQRGSKRAQDMLDKVHSVRRTIFATGTPLTNSLAELFVLQTFLQPEQLKFRNIDSFNMWLNTFAERESTIECDVTGKLKTVTRFNSFCNLKGLMTMFGAVCDANFENEDENIPKFEGYVDVVVKKSLLQAEYFEDLAQRAESVRLRQVKPEDDNLLKITADARACSLDARLKGVNDYSPTNKLNICADKVYEVYLSSPGKAQVIFSDLGVPKDSFNVYDELKFQLVRRGIPASKIAFATSANTESKRKKMFRQINNGEISVVIGSTEKLGIGVNIQENLKALHHLSIPWRPSDMEQREGRILRQGNKCESVLIFRYITEGSFDSYLWQILENKQRFISDFLSGVTTKDKMEDLSVSILTYSELKALAIGADSLVRERLEKSNELERTEIDSRRRQRRLDELKNSVKDLENRIEKQKKLIKTTESDSLLYNQMKHKVFLEDRIGFGEKILALLSKNVKKSESKKIADYQGFDVVLPQGMESDKPYVYLKSKNGGVYHLKMKCDKPLGVSLRMDILLDRLNQRVESQKEELSHLQKLLEDTQADIALGNEHIKKVEKLERELEIIDKKIKESEAD